LGAVLSSWFVGHIGRKPLLVLLVVPNLIGWGLLLAAGIDVSFCSTSACYETNTTVPLLISPNFCYLGSIIIGSMPRRRLQISEAQFSTSSIPSGISLSLRQRD